MKNILVKTYFLLLICITISCSDENENNLFNDLNPVAYKSHKRSIEDQDFIRFAEKYNEVFIEIQKNSKILETVNIVIVNNDFNDISKLDEKFLLLVTELDILYSKYDFVYVNEKLDKLLKRNFLVDTGLSGEGIDIGEINIIYGPCENGCINAGVACGRAVDSIYDRQMTIASNMLLGGNAVGAAIVATAARIQQGIGQSNCANDLFSCMEGC